MLEHRVAKASDPRYCTTVRHWCTSTNFESNRISRSVGLPLMPKQWARRQRCLLLYGRMRSCHKLRQALLSTPTPRCTVGVWRPALRGQARSAWTAAPTFRRAFPTTISRAQSTPCAARSLKAWANQSCCRTPSLLGNFPHCEPGARECRALLCAKETADRRRGDSVRREDV